METTRNTNPAQQQSRTPVTDVKFRAIFNSASLPIAITNLNGEFIEANDAFCRMLGYSNSEIRARTINAVSHPEDRNASSMLVAQLANGEINDFTTTKKYLHKAGHAVWGKVSASAVRDDVGNIECFVAIVEDISSLKQAEEEKERLTSQLHSTFESMSDAFYLLDEKFRLLYMNPQAENFAGTRKEECLGQVLWEKFPAIKNTLLHTELLTSKQTKASFQIEYFAESVDTWISLYCTPTPNGYAVFFHSTSEQRAMEQKIKESEQRLKYISEATLDVCWDCDLDNETIWWSNSLDWNSESREHGYTSDIRHWMDRVHPEDLPAVHNTIVKAINGTTDFWKVQYRFQTANNHYAFVEDRAMIIRNDDGQALRMLGGISDITERLELEEQLRQSQRLESIGQLTGGVAHDFNNLLTVILGNAELVNMEISDSSPLQSYMKTIASAAEKGSDLTHRLLAFARKQTLQPKNLYINEMLRGMKGMLLRTLGEQIDIKYFLQDDVWTTLADPNQLESAVLNLCINARDAMSKGGTLTIETHNARFDEDAVRQDQDITPGAYTCIIVSDTGIGIPPESLDHVFEPFFTTKETGKGTGLGLSTVFGFVKQSRGHIKIESELGKGTSVKLFLPRSIRPEEKPVVENTQISIPHGNETILLVEDDAMLLELAQKLLTSFGYRVFTADDGNEALKVLGERDDIQMLFTDVVMPRGMGGVELAEKAADMKPGIKVLFTSGYTQESLFHNNDPARQVDLLVKPYQPVVLAQKIRQVLDKT